MNAENLRFARVAFFFQKCVKEEKFIWCRGNYCGCLGCINGGRFRDYSTEWHRLFGGDYPYLTERDVNDYKSHFVNT